jgi:hypothetical protein
MGLQKKIWERSTSLSGIDAPSKMLWTMVRKLACNPVLGAGQGKAFASPRIRQQVPYPTPAVFGICDKKADSQRALFSGFGVRNFLKQVVY